MLWQSCPETSYISVSQHHLSQYGCHPETVEFISAYTTVKHLCPTQHWSCEDYLQWVATKTSYMHEIALKTVNSQTKLNMKKWMCSPVPVHHLHQKWSWLDNIIPLTSRTCFLESQMTAKSEQQSQAWRLATCNPSHIKVLQNQRSLEEVCSRQFWHFCSPNVHVSTQYLELSSSLVRETTGFRIATRQCTQFML